MPTFQQLLPPLLLGTLAVIIVHLVTALARRKPVSGRPRWGIMQVLIYVATLASVAVLGWTAFVAVLREGTLLGWPLFVHMFGAGAFTALLPLMALAWGAAHGPRRTTTDSPPTAPATFFWLPRLSFWIFLASGLVVTLTMLLSMLPIFGTDGLHQLLSLHRYSGLIVVAAAVVHLYGVIIQRIGLR